MALTLPPRKYLSAIKSIPSWVSAGPPALIATTSRLERITPLEELDDEEELLDDELPDDELELLEDELLDEEVEELEGSAPGSLPPQPANSNAAHNKASHASRAFRFIALIDIVHPVNFQQRIFSTLITTALVAAKNVEILFHKQSQRYCHLGGALRVLDYHVDNSSTMSSLGAACHFRGLIQNLRSTSDQPHTPKW